MDSRNTEYFPEYLSYPERALRLLIYMYGIINYGNLFADYFIEWLIEAVLIKYKCQMSIYYKYAPNGTNCFVIYYVDVCVYWYTYETLGNGFWTIHKRDSI